MRYIPGNTARARHKTRTKILIAVVTTLIAATGSAVLFLSPFLLTISDIVPAQLVVTVSNASETSPTPPLKLPAGDSAELFALVHVDTQARPIGQSGIDGHSSQPHIVEATCGVMVDESPFGLLFSFAISGGAEFADAEMIKSAALQPVASSHDGWSLDAGGTFTVTPTSSSLTIDASGHVRLASPAGFTIQDEVFDLDLEITSTNVTCSIDYPPRTATAVR